MRFTEAGPSIPNELLDSRDAGDVVFLCGAGVSIPAGLPDFFRLTVDVAHRLGVDPTSQVGRMIEAEQSNRAASIANANVSISFDRVFTLLTRAYGTSQVEKEVANSLSCVRRHRLKNHRAILDLARGPDGRQRLITTNFDRLFQRAQPRLHTYGPPQLPDLSQRDGFDGVVHLHGILPASPITHSTGSLGLILSSGDFGRAYLADAWATRFICDLLDRHIVVLLGYSADDPPVRYLLEGLSLSGRIGERRLFAFAAGNSAVVASDWRERGVTSIAYDPGDHHHHLWGAVHGWAERARNPIVWRSQIATLAQTSPDQLRPYERGQVAALCTSIEGATAFASASPEPPAEWLSVFDAFCRYAKPGRSGGWAEESSAVIDPFKSYGLDDDPPRDLMNQRDRPPPGVNFLSALKSDDVVATESGIVDWRRSSPLLNQRLMQLVSWILSVMASPTVVWWAASRGSLHYALHRQLSWRLDQDKASFDPVVRKAWRLVLEAQEALPDRLAEGWHGISSHVAKEGWTSQSVRLFADATRPRISARSPWFEKGPPQLGVAPLPLSRIANFEVVYPQLMDDIESIPKASVAAVLQAIRRNLERGAELEEEISSLSPKLPTLYPERKAGDHHYSDDEKYYVTFAKLFRRLASFDQGAARREFSSWRPESYFFVPLRIWALADPKLTSASEVGRTLRQLDRDAFWNPSFARELLWTIRARWKSLSVQDRHSIEVKIAQGREKYDLENTAEYKRRRASSSAARLLWMKDAGLKLSAKARTQLRRLKGIDPRWNDSWAKTADASHESRVGYVKQETSPMPISGLPLSKVITRCEELKGQREFASFTEHDPFRGLVEAKPRRAMRVLAYEARQKNYPPRYWSRLLQYWPSSAPPSLVAELAGQLAKLPPVVLMAIGHEATSWIGSHYALLDHTDRKIAHSCFDRILQSLEASGLDALRSGLGVSSIGGVEIPSNRMGVDYAINAPTGHLAQGLIDALFNRKRKRDKPIAQDLRSRLEWLLRLEDEGGWHALTIVAQQLHSLFLIDRDWTRRVLLPLFDPAEAPAEAAWSGFLRAKQLARPALFGEMKEFFLDAIAATPRWTADGLSSLGEHLVLALELSTSRRKLLGFQEARVALRASDGPLRQQVLWFIKNRASERRRWAKLIIPFFQYAWPRERELQTDDTTRALIEFLVQLGDRFSEGLSLVADLLVPSENVDIFVFQLGSDGKHGHADVTTRYPLDTLFLLSRVIDSTRERAPYGLAEVLSQLAAAAPEVRHDERWQRLHRLALT